MALLDVDFYSYYLGQDVSMSVLLPERMGCAPEPDSSRHKVLYLLHGHSDDHTAFIRKSDIEMMVRGLDLIVVMPQAHRGFYTNPVYGYRYEDFFAKELPVVAGNFFHASTRREDSFIAGISMGGYGALRLALRYPGLYSKAASLSGASDPYYAKKLCPGLFTVGDFARNIDNVFGGEEAFNVSDNSIEVLSGKVEDPPELYQLRDGGCLYRGA